MARYRVYYETGGLFKAKADAVILADTEQEAIQRMQDALDFAQVNLEYDFENADHEFYTEQLKETAT